MFCPECGAKNLGDAAFCEECGAKLKSTAQVSKPNTNLIPSNNANHLATSSQVVPVIPRTPMSKRSKFIIGEVIILALLVFCFFTFGKKQYSADKIAENHFKKVMNGDWEGVYSDLDITKSEFLTKEKFLNSKKYEGSTQYNSHKVQSTENSKGISTYVDISYRIKGDSDDSSYYIELAKQSSKSFLFFDSWKIDPSNYISEEFTVSVPQGVKVVLGGVTLDSSYKEKSTDDSYNDTYVIPALFKGTYDLLITMDNMNDVKTTVSTDEGSYYLDSMAVKDEIMTDLVNKSGDALKTIYTTAFKQGSMADMSDLFTADSEQLTNLNDQFEYFSTDFDLSDGTGFKNVDFYNIKGTAYSDIQDDKLCVYVTLDYSYDLTYLENDWWSDDILTQTYSSSDSDSFTYVLEDGKWLIYSADFNNLYY